MKHIAFLVSGGDAPGIRACLFAIVSAAPRYGMELLAVPHGLDGLIDGCFEESFYLGPETVSYGGSPIPSGRSKRFLDKEQQRQAAGQIEAQGVEGVVILGGGGSVQAADALSRQCVPCICVPVTIDNEVWGTDYTLGFDSGVHHILGSAAAIRETALALSGRVFLVETLGANTGHIALAAGLAGCIGQLAKRRPGCGIHLRRRDPARHRRSLTRSHCRACHARCQADGVRRSSGAADGQARERIAPWGRGKSHGRVPE